MTTDAGKKCYECGEHAVHDSVGPGRYRRYKDEDAIEMPHDLIVPVCVECGEFSISESKAAEIDAALEPIYKAFHPEPLPVRPCHACGADCAWCEGANKARKAFPRAKVPPVHDADTDNSEDHHCSKCFTELEDVSSPFDQPDARKWE